MGTLSELAGVILAGFAAFFGGIGIVLGALLLWMCGLASALCLVVAVFAGGMYLLAGRAHDAHIALVYLGYAAIPFVLTFVFGYYQSKLSQKRQHQAARHRIGPLTLVRDESFTPNAGAGEQKIDRPMPANND